MEISNELLVQIIIWAVIILSILGTFMFILNPKLRLKSRKILPPSTTFFGATHEFRPNDERGAVEHINEVQADKKMEEEENGDPEEK